MRIGRLLAVAAIVIGASVAFAPAAPGTLASCAQRVIRDWYSGGRVDGTYPLRCYRAAIRALPSDVLHYSNADRDIARALAYARRGRSDPGNGSTPAQTPVDRQPPAATDRQAPASTVAAEPVEVPPLTRPADGTPRLASGAAQPQVSSALPYPILVLAMLAAVLLVSATAGWLARRRT